MKTLDLSAVTPSVGIIPQKDTVEHITSSYLEGVASLAKSMIPTSWQTGKLVILHGCVDTGTPPTRTLSAGAVYYNGEVYQVPAASFTTTGLQIGIWTLQDVNTGTESKLTDGSDVHVLVNNKFVFAAGLAGSGDFDENSSNVVSILVKTKVVANQDPVTGITTSTLSQPIIITTLEEDTKTEYNTSNGRFTPKQAGWYNLSASCSILAISGGSLGGSVIIGWEKNGTGSLSGFFANIINAYGSNVGCMSSTIKYFNGTTDYVRLMYNQSEAYVIGSAFSISITLQEAS